MRRIAPGPRGVALAGALRGLLRDPLATLDQLHARHGDVVELRAPGVRLVLLAHPADIEQLLVGHARSTDKGATLRRVAIGMGRNLFTLEGVAHEERRRLLTPLFRPRDVTPHVPHTREQAVHEAGTWRDGTPLDAGTRMDELVLAAMGHVMVGRPHGGEAAELSWLVHESVALTPRLLDPAFEPKARAWPRHRRDVDELVARWDALCDRVVQRARAEPTGHDGSADVVHRLLAGHADGRALLDDDAAVREELRGLLMSAHETTSLALAWTLHELARDEAVQDQLAAELADVLGDEPVDASHVPRLRLARACLDEALRLRGGTFVPRGALEALRLDHAGVVVPAGTELLASMWVTHRDPRWWASPESWRPARFLAPDPARPRFAYFPFGGGRRTCIGMHLALQSGVVVLAELLRRWRVEPCPGDGPVAPVSNVLVRPQRPIVVVPRARMRRE